METVMTVKIPQPLFDTLDKIKDHEAPYAYPAELIHAKNFLLSYRGSHATFNAYRRELERLLQWSALIVGRPPAALKREDIEAYILFCQRPPKEWIGLRKVDRFLPSEDNRIANPDWRPFVVTVKKSEKLSPQELVNKYTLSQSAVQSIFAILGSYYNFLIQEGIIEFNPVTQIRQKSKFLRKKGRESQRQVRRLSELQWHYVIETAEKMAQENPDVHERTLFIMSALYGMYLRISELAASERWTPKMGDFEHDADGLWWFRTVGKGNKERLVTVSQSMLESLKRYRLSRGLSVFPTPAETTLLIPKLKGRGPVNSTRQIRDIVQSCFDKAYARMCQDNLKEDAETLRAATVHWLRHTGISEDVRTRPREHVRDDAGHSSSAITDRYIDVELRARHASGQKKKIKPE